MTDEEVYKHISSDPEILHGRPCVKGTRIPVWLVVAMLGDGMTEEEILREYPSLNLIDIKACLKFASYVVDYESVPI